MLKFTYLYNNINNEGVREKIWEKIYLQKKIADVGSLYL